MTSGVDMALENLKTELNNLRLKLSEYRKSGFDTKIAELKFMNLPFKVKLAEATKSYKDIENINSMLNSVHEELEEVKNQGNESFDKGIQKEIEKYESFLEKRESGKIYKDYSENEMMKTTEKLINDANDSLNNGDYYKALHNYLDIRNIYKYLPKTLKKPVYYNVMAIYKKILSSGIIKTKEDTGNKE